MSTSKSWLYEVPGMHEYKGVLCMPDMTPDVLKWMEDELEFEDGDVLLCGYPCTGDIWLQEIVWHMLHPEELNNSAKKLSIGFRVPHMDHSLLGKKTPRELFQESGPPRVFKSRLPADLISRHLEGKAKVIYWTMDPRNTLMKYLEMYNTKGKFLKFPPIDFKDFFNLFQEGQLFEGDWFQSTLSFLPYVDRGDNFLFLRYEEVAPDLKGTVKTVARFLDIELTDDQVDRLADMVPFDGQTDWDRHFSAEQLDWYRNKYRETMAGTILEDVYV